MGRAKDEWMNAQDKRELAIDIACRSGALKRCEFHTEAVLEGSKDAEDAYRLGNAMFSSGELGLFSNRREMTDLLKEVIEESYGSECAACKKWEDE